MADSAEHAGPETGTMVAQTELRAGALGLGSVIVQAITHVAPAMGFLTGAAFIATYAGTGAPLAYLGAFIVCMSIGLSLIQLAKHLPSAGGYFTYVSRTLHPRFGFMTAWLYFLYDPTCMGINLAIASIIIQATLHSYAGIDIPWGVMSLVGVAIVIAVMYRGVKISGRTLMILAAIEITILVLFALFGILNPGPGGVSATPFQIDPSFGISKTAVGIVFAIFAFTGFEAVAPMAEETKNPRRNLPLAIIISLVVMGAMYVFCVFGLVTGWGSNTYDTTFAGQGTNVFMDLAVRLWGKLGYLLLLFAIINSVLAVSISAGNAGTRVWFSMARGGALPKWFGKVHPTYKTPVNAIIAYAVVSLLLEFGGAWVFGGGPLGNGNTQTFAPDQLFFWFGIAITLGLIGVYGLGNIGVIRYYWVERRDEFNWFWHVAIPVVSCLAILAVGYYSLQGLAFPFNLAPAFVVVWILVGIAVLAYVRMKGNEEWLLKAGEIAYEHQASPEELAGTV
jgi:amino acid transporter